MNNMKQAGQATCPTERFIFSPVGQNCFCCTDTDIRSGLPDHVNVFEFIVPLYPESESESNKNDTVLVASDRTCVNPINLNPENHTIAHGECKDRVIDGKECRTNYFVYSSENTTCSCCNDM